MDRRANPYLIRTWVFGGRVGALASIKNANTNTRFPSRKVLNGPYVKRLSRRS